MSEPMPKRTLGPWSVNADRQRVHHIPLRICQSDNMTLATVWNSSWANAHLIASAPELLEALESALESLRMESECEGCTTDPCTQCRAKAAIKKAYGGKP